MTEDELLTAVAQRIHEAGGVSPMHAMRAAGDVVRIVHENTPTTEDLTPGVKLREGIRYRDPETGSIWTVSMT